MKIAVIGGGPAGLAAAYEISRHKGLQVKVFEAAGRVGGMAGSFELWGQIVDFGPHRFFSSDPRVNKFWLEAVDGDYTMVSRLTRIFYKNKFFHYPLKAANALFGIGPIEAARCLLSYFRFRAFPIEPEDTFEAWVTNRFGRRLFQIFFQSYTEKLWGIPCSVLDSDFAAQRIKKFSLGAAILTALAPNKSNKHKTLVDEFAYPRLGAGQPYEILKQKIEANGGSVLLSSPIESIEIEGDGVRLTTRSEKTESFDLVISTMPLTLLVQKLGAPDEVLKATTKLRFRNTILVYLQLDKQKLFEDQWIYVHAENLKTGRITNFRNWNETILQGKSETIIAMEYWCQDEDAIWAASEEDLVKLASQEIIQTGLVVTGEVVEGRVIRVPKCYPIYESGYEEHLTVVQEFVDTIPQVVPIGRYGSFKYNNQDHSILMGLLAAQNITEGTNHDLWGVNTDYEYQESSRITATGLIEEK